MDAIEHRIIDLLREKEEDITINEIANTLKIDRHTAAKRLESLNSKGIVEFRTIGKSKMWKISKSPFLNALKNNDSISNNIKNILQHVDGNVTIKDKKNILWSNGKAEERCCGPNDKKCKDCIVEETFKTGAGTSSVKNWTKKKVRITTQPIKDENDNTVAVVEIVKRLK